MSDLFEALQAKNPNIEILSVFDPNFSQIGRIIDGIDCGQSIDYAKTRYDAESSVVYEPAVPGLEQDEALMGALAKEIYGDMPVQLGWCYGSNEHLNGLEYHKGSEVIVAVTDAVLLLGHYQDILWKPEPSYDTSNLKAYYLPQSTVVEIYPWCLHFAPTQVSKEQGFCTLVALPKLTNFPIRNFPKREGEGKLLFAKNKWLLVHPEAQDLIQEGAFAGLVGENIQIKSL